MAGAWAVNASLLSAKGSGRSRALDCACWVAGADSNPTTYLRHKILLWMFGLPRGIRAGGSGLQGHSSAGSACLRQHYSTEVCARMVMHSLEIFRNFSEIVGGTAGFVKTGCLMGVGERDHQALKRAIAMQQAVGIRTSLLSPKETKEIEPRVSTHDPETRPSAPYLISIR